MEVIGCPDQYQVSGREKGLMGNNEYVSRALYTKIIKSKYQE